MAIKNRIITLLSCQPLWQLVLLISVIAVLYLATTSENYPVPAPANDKINHFIAFLELTLLAFLAWPRAHLLYIAPPLLLFGLLIEVVQSFLPYREFSLLDVAADGTGIVIGVALWHGFFRNLVTTRFTN